MSYQKELHFFMNSAWSSKDRGLEWYSKQFEEGKDCPVRGESSPGYSVDGFTEEVVDSMSEVLPNAKLIYMVRDPINRVRSHYLEEVFSGRIPPDFTLDQIISIGFSGSSINSYLYQTLVQTSLYYKQLRYYLKKYDLSSIHLECIESFSRKDTEVLGRIYQFLNVDKFTSDSLKEKLNVNSQKQLRVVNPTSLARRLPGYGKFSGFTPQFAKNMYRKLISRDLDAAKLSRISSANEDKLKELFAPDVAQLRSLTGHTFSDWSV